MTDEAAHARWQAWPDSGATVDLPLMSTRTRNRLVREGIFTLDQLSEWSATELSKMLQFGPAGLVEAERALASRGLSLAPSPPPPPPPPAPERTLSARHRSMLEMRRAGRPYYEIGEVWGVGFKRARQLVREAEQIIADGSRDQPGNDTTKGSTS